MTMTGTRAAQLAAGYIGSGPSTFYSYYSRNFESFKSGSWCACFVSCILHMAGASCAGFPGVYCPTCRNKGVEAHAEVAVKDAKPGDVVFFNWDYNQNADHVGICESVNATYKTITTVDGNVSNEVGRRTRGWSEVMTVIRPTYAKEDELFIPKTVRKGSNGNEVVMLQALLNLRMGAGIKLDADFGDFTQSKVKEWQKSHGLYADGVCGPKTWPTLLGK